MSIASVSARERARELEAQLRANERGVLVYNASDRVLVQSCNGRPYKLYPDGPVLDTHTGRMVVHSGETEIYAQYDFDEKDLAEYEKSAYNPAKRPQPKTQVLSAIQVASHIVGKKEHIGLEILSGENDEENDARRQRARGRFLDWRTKNAELVLQNFRKRTTGWHQDVRNVGQPAPLMNEEEMAAEDFLTSKNAGEFDSTKVKCRFNCGYWRPSSMGADLLTSAFRRHEQLRHVLELEAEAPKEVPEELVAEKAASKPERGGSRRRA